MKAFRLENQAYVSTDSIEEAELVLCEDPSQEEIDYLHNQYDIPLDFITDGLNRYMVPRKENYETDNHELIQLLLFLYPLVKIDEADRLEYQTLPLSIIILNGKMIMVYPKELPFLERTINQNNQSEESLFLLQILSLASKMECAVCAYRYHYSHISDHEIDVIGVDARLVFCDCFADLHWNHKRGKQETPTVTLENVAIQFETSLAYREANSS